MLDDAIPVDGEPGTLDVGAGPEDLRAGADRLLLAAAVEQTADAVVVTDPAGDIVFVNPAFERLSGFSRDHVIGMNLKTMTPAPGTYEAMWSTLAEGRAWHGELVNRRKDGTEHPTEITITPVYAPPEVLSAYISVQRDLTHLREVEAELVLEARVRALLGEAITAVATTSTLAEAAQIVCDGLASLPGIHIVQLVAFLDVGDAVVIASRGQDGPEPGDRLPESRARYLQERAASGPWGERPGPNDGGAENADRMRALGAQAIAYGPIPLPIPVGEDAAGVLVVGTSDPRYGRLVSEVMPPLVGFGASSNTLVVGRLTAMRRDHQLRRDLAAVFEARAFRPVFQPIVDLQTGETVGYEALTRFDSGAAPAACFAEAWSVDMGPVLELATLEAAVSAANNLPAGRWLDLNVSPRLLEAPQALSVILAAADRPVLVEITEHEPITDYGATREAVTALGHNVRLAVDDAGVGIANFGHIIELRPDFVKLDMSLVRRVNVDPSRQALVVAMRHFARTAGCRLIAEGIETDAELSTLRQLGVDFGQGYWFGRPDPSERWATTENVTANPSPA